MRHCLLLFLDFEMVELAKDIEAFGKACKHLIVSIDKRRSFTKEESLFICFYCDELRDKAAPHTHKQNNLYRMASRR